MPEGDTIHRVANRLRPALEGQPLEGVELPRVPRPHPGVGEIIGPVRAHGKHLLIDFSGGSTLRVHLRMTGSWYLYRRGEPWRRSRRSAVVILEVPDWVAVCFNAPDVGLAWSGDEGIEHLGPDLCEPEPDFGEIMRRARAGDPSVPIGELVMDQRIAAGIGNVYKCEALFAERVAPTAAVGSLDDRRLLAVFRRAHHQLRENLDRPGARKTVPEGHAVYGRSGHPCRRCATTIVRIVQGAELPRSTDLCPTCQRD